MEFVFSYFWLFKVLFALLLFFTVYKIVIHLKAANTRSAIRWGIFAGVLLLLQAIIPVRMSTPSYTSTQSQAIETAKILPPKVEDNSFQERTSKDITIHPSQFKD